MFQSEPCLVRGSSLLEFEASKPTVHIVADGAEITTLINDRLPLLRTFDKPGMESDEFELGIDDRDSAVALPKCGAGIEIYLGCGSETLTRLGRYVVDDVEASVPPDTLAIRGRAWRHAWQWQNHP